MESLKYFADSVWYVLRNWKPARTFWQTLSALLAVYAVGAGTSLTTVSWEASLSASALAAVISFVSLMAGGDSMWTEDKTAAEL